MTTKQLIKKCQEFLAQQKQKSIKSIYMFYALNELKLSKEQAEKQPPSYDGIRFYCWLYFNYVQFSKDFGDWVNMYIEVAKFVFSDIELIGTYTRGGKYVSNTNNVIKSTTASAGDLFALIMEWTLEFLKLHADTDWGESDIHYSEAIEEFCEEKTRPN